MATSNARFWKHVLAKTSKSVALSILAPAVIKALREVKDFEETVHLPDLPRPEARASEVIQLLSQMPDGVPPDAARAVSTWASYHCGLDRPGLLFNAAHALLHAAVAKRGHSMHFRDAIQCLSWFDVRIVRDPVHQLCLQAGKHFEERRLEHMFSIDLDRSTGEPES